jgi:hypothetical protein
MPERIQRKRTRGWRLPPGAVCVDRTTRWGNPWTVAGAIEAGFADNPADARALCVAQHRAWLNEGPDVVWSGKRQFDRRIVLAEISLLRGRDLACPCPLPEPGQPDLCHAATLVALANAPRTRTPDAGLPDGSRRITVQRCCNGCGDPLGDVTDAEITAAVDGRSLPDVTWECPRCSSTAQKLRDQLATEQRRREFAEGRATAAEDQAQAAEHRARAYKGHATRIRNRAAAGVCPVDGCRRHFADLGRHMAGQHPDYSKDTDRA